jgi:hypothetical protein
MLKLKISSSHLILTVQEAGAAKMVALERSVRFKEGHLEMTNWHLQKASLQLEILKDELKYIQKIPVSYNYNFN